LLTPLISLLKMLQEVDYYDFLPSAEYCDMRQSVGRRTKVCISSLDDLLDKEVKCMTQFKNPQICPPPALDRARRIVIEQQKSHTLSSPSYGQKVVHHASHLDGTNVRAGMTVPRQFTVAFSELVKDPDRTSQQAKVLL
jgi:hypothetical protein